MPNQSPWLVTIQFDATKTVEIAHNAVASAEEAKSKALELVDQPTLCHHCSREIELGDPIDALAPSDGDGAWNVPVLFDATKTVKVMAESISEAQQAGEEAIDTPTLCCHCSGQIELGDAIETLTPERL